MISTQVRAHGAEPLEARQFQGAVDKIIKQHTKTLKKDVRLAAGAEIVVAAGELALLMAAAKRRASGGLGLGAYAAFRAALLQYQRGLRETTKAVNKAARGVPGDAVSSLRRVVQGARRFQNRVGDLARGRGAAQIAGQVLAFAGDPFDGLHQPLGAIDAPADHFLLAPLGLLLQVETLQGDSVQCLELLKICHRVDQVDQVAQVE